MRIYFDNAATTPLSPKVLEAMLPFYTEFHGNPSSIHADGRKGRTAIEDARKMVAKHLNASIGEIFFTSGGTESNNMALKCAVRDLGLKRIISSPIEHHCVLHTLDTLVKYDNVVVDQVQLDELGRINLDHLKSLLTNRALPTMVSLMHTNNEIGNVLDLESVSELCQEHDALFHSDTVQSIGYLPFDVEKTKINFMTGSAHKFYGPKGVGFIYINGDNIIHSMLKGGSQERNMRPGTENVAGVTGLSTALDESYSNMEKRVKKIKDIKEYLIQQLKSNFEDIHFNGDYNGRSHPKILSVSFPNTAKTELLVFSLDIAGISASGGSACASGVENASHVLSALWPDSERKTVRFSFSHHNTKEEVDYLVKHLFDIVK
ncbi:MAG: cysteine desulfurase family protein [Bacteroidota bacterium]